MEAIPLSSPSSILNKTMSIKTPKKVAVEDPDCCAGMATPQVSSNNVSSDTSISSKPIKALPTFEQQLEDEINKRVKKGK